MCRVPDAGKLTGFRGSAREKRSTKRKQSNTSNCRSNKQVSTFRASLFPPACKPSTFYCQPVWDGFHRSGQRGGSRVPYTYRIYTLQSGTFRFPSVSSGAPQPLLPSMRTTKQANEDLPPPKIPWSPPKRVTAISRIRNKPNRNSSCPPCQR